MPYAGPFNCLVGVREFPAEVAGAKCSLVPPDQNEVFDMAGGPLWKVQGQSKIPSVSNKACSEMHPLNNMKWYVCIARKTAGRYMHEEPVVHPDLIIKPSSCKGCQTD